jgi:hypothetical protein
MILEGRVARFRLSAEGKVALKGFFEKPTVSAFVECVDELGAWIHLPSKKRMRVGQPSILLLLKWNYFSTAVLDYEPERPLTREPIGFKIHGIRREPAKQKPRG